MSALGANEENTQNISLDVPELSVLLQITRYKFESFENIDITENLLSTIELKCHVSDDDMDPEEDDKTCDLGKDNEL
ncbi:hypothetical protein RN001_012823 [Aquatica leii]|uniref:Uncharacterized protein n=1 Tax=Aquatica leii TaxID=1421715 RepID=A0AAN7P6S6_9COLE|nr:hypothetical protein RN001_012823 [Aquatica leii]